MVPVKVVLEGSPREDDHEEAFPPYEAYEGEIKRGTPSFLTSYRKRCGEAFSKLPFPCRGGDKRSMARTAGQ